MIELSMRYIMIRREQSIIVRIKGYKYIADVGIINFVAFRFLLLNAKICSRQSAMRTLVCFITDLLSTFRAFD